MKVLVGCEFSGVVREEFRKLGHDAWSCDLLDTEIPGQHYQCDIVDALYKKVWDLIILHLPCTKIALCGNSTYGKGMKRHNERLDAIVWTKNVYETAKSLCDKVAFENPKNVMGAYIGKRTQAIQPYQFGHMERKETWWWLYGLPNLVPTNDVQDEMLLLPKNFKIGYIICLHQKIGVWSVVELILELHRLWLYSGELKNNTLSRIIGGKR